MGATPHGTELSGWTVLVPRGGDLGDRLADEIRSRGGWPVIAPVIDFAPAPDESALLDALGRLAAGAFDWLAVTSATTVTALTHHAAVVPPGTRVAAVGDATATALSAAGYRVDFVPHAEHSAAAMVAEWPTTSGSVLIPQSEIAEPRLAQGLAAAGLRVETVVAYRTRGIRLAASVAHDAAGGRFDAILLTSGSTAREIAAQLAPLPQQTVIACIGGSTATAARLAGLGVRIVSPVASAEALVSALADHAVDPTTSRTPIR